MYKMRSKYTSRQLEKIMLCRLGGTFENIFVVYSVNAAKFQISRFFVSVCPVRHTFILKFFVRGFAPGCAISFSFPFPFLFL